VCKLDIGSPVVWGDGERPCAGVIRYVSKDRRTAYIRRTDGPKGAYIPVRVDKLRDGTPKEAA
jgi:hypothetical protein